MKNIVAPLPFPGATYDQKYFNETIRVLNLYFRQLQNPGASVVSTLQFLQVPTDPGSLPAGTVWHDEANNVLRIVVRTSVALTGSSATASAGTVTP